MIARLVREAAPQPTVFSMSVESGGGGFRGGHQPADEREGEGDQMPSVGAGCVDYVPPMKGLAAYRSGTLLQRKGYAEAFKRSPEIYKGEGDFGPGKSEI